MKVPMSWLREYVDPPASPADLAKLLVMAGVGVESIEGDVLDLEITANRADLLSMLGVARETGVNLRRPVRLPEVAFAEAAGEVAKAYAVDVAARELCPRYTARAVSGVKVGPSPSWMVERLEAAGIRSINNVVDITNYVLLESGQPLHAFDARLLRGKKIVVRRANADEKLTAIDGKEYRLTKETLVIADAERAVAIAGVMGGKDTEITAGTVDVVLESAQFDPVSVRRTGRRLALSSDSSYRFERGVDFDTVDWASRRAVSLILRLAGGQAQKGVLDISAPRPARPVARVRPARISQVLGMKVAVPRVREILSGLGAQVVGSDTELEVTAPVGRRDLKIEVDYIEEVARIEGYDKIPCDTGFGLRVAVDQVEDLVRETVRSTLSGLGAYECLTWSFAEAGTPNRVSFWTEAPPIPLRDPQGNVDRTLRESLAPRLLEVLETNESYKEALRPVYEVAHLYRRQGKSYGEKNVLAIAAPGEPLGVKGLVQTVLEQLSIPLDLVPAPMPFLEPGTAAEFRIGGAVAGYLGQAGEGLSGLRSPASVAEIDFDALVGAARLTRPYKDFNRQPPVDRDLAVVLPEATAWKQVEAAVRAVAPATLESVRFLNEYRGKGIDPGHKSWAFTMVFRAADRTLTGPEVDASVGVILESLKRELQARLR
ncbi:MAG TPA: phenylalanine--tRNA ligase subunit beta [Planctomycetota bacterium]|nr:phenylalanine--tRNA ligase subunit beta [Planctomycetota bacterium]